MIMARRQTVAGLAALLGVLFAGPSQASAVRTRTSPRRCASEGPAKFSRKIFSLAGNKWWPATVYLFVTSSRSEGRDKCEESRECRSCPAGAS